LVKEQAHHVRVNGGASNSAAFRFSRRFQLAGVDWKGKGTVS